MSAEISTEICVQRSLQHFCTLTLSDTTSYYSNLAAPTNPHDILTLNIVISSHERKTPYPPGTILSVRGRLAPGSKGAMVTLFVSEHVHVDRTLSGIPTKASFNIFGAVRKMKHNGEDCLVVQTEWDGPALFGVMKQYIHCEVFEEIATEDAVLVIGTFAGIHHPVDSEQVLLGLVPQTITVTGEFSYTPEANYPAEAEKPQKDSPKPEKSKSDAYCAPTWSKEDEDDRAVSSLLENTSNESSSVEIATANSGMSDGADDQCAEAQLDDEGWPRDQLDSWASSLEAIHTPAGLARRIPDVLSPWSSPVLGTRSLKRPSESSYGEWDDRKRQRRNGH